MHKNFASPKRVFIANSNGEPGDGKLSRRGSMGRDDSERIVMFDLNLPLTQRDYHVCQQN